MSSTAASIDGIAVAAPAGATILEAAAGAGLADRIPALCHRPGSAPQGSCRLCYVSIAGRERPVPACSTRLEPGMVVETASTDLESRRRALLELLAGRYPGAVSAADGRGGRNAGQFRDLLRRYGVGAPGPAADIASRPPATGHPYLRFDAQACVVCRRCIQACEDLQGQFVFAVGERGNETRLLFGSNESFEDSPCVSCGACVEECPTGALFDVDREPRPPAGAAREATVTSTVCGYCGVGCNVEVAVEDGDVRRVTGSPGAAVNRGHLCAKGRYAHGWVRSPDRLTQPLLRTPDGWQPLSWDAAMSWVAGRLGELRAKHGADSLAVLTSSRSTNEAAYLLQKVFRSVLGTNNVDCCARVCHSSTALALRLATGTGAATASFDDIERATTIVVAGANPTEAHPVVGARIRQAARRGAQLLVIDPRQIELCRHANLHLAVAPGGNVALFNGLAKALLEAGAVDQEYVADRTEGLEDLRAHLESLSMAALAQQAGVSQEAIREAARLMVARGPALFVTGLGLSELTQGTDSVLALTNLALLTGSPGRPGAGLLPLRGQNNVQGNADMGSAPDYLTGYQPLDDEQVRGRLRKVWGVVPPAQPGLTIPGMLAAAREGRLRGMWIQGEDIVQSDPDEAAVVAALRSLDLLVVQELFMSETAKFAHLLLPAAGVFEQDGTFTNAERRIQRVRAALAPPGAARPDWEVARDLGRALGSGWTYASPSEVMDEIAQVAPGLFGGVNYSRLEAAGLQWPCPAGGHPGTATVHAPGFLRGKGRLFVLDYLPTPERVSATMPYILITGRVLQHYNVGTMTRRTPNRQLVDHDTLVMNAHDAARAGLASGDRVVVQSRTGRIEVPMRVGTELPPGTLFLSFHFPETHANALTGANRDPRSHCPEYKVTAVNVTRAPPP